MNNFRISASIVTYNNEREIRGVLNSLLDSSVKDLIDIYVVDNCSTDRTIKILQNTYKNINLINMKSNVGYGRGHNAAIQVAKSKYHLVINPDINFDINLIENLISYLESNEDIVLCIPNVHDNDNNLKHPPKKDPTIRYLIGRYFASRGGIFKKWADEYECKNTNLVRPFEIEFCSGSFMAARTETLQKLDGFDSRYFLYFEDADLSRKMRKMGKVVCNPNYYVQHEGKRESHKSIKGLQMMLSSMFKYFNKWGWKY
ncbi:glycosyltransferase family 2 protein [Cytobacillus gottheilii]|uniref:glycosyltransferase family 2 protein n=1 Tax=Cytobacillus gottheilii TaxID=859144 RepID=UPI000830816F|nr:glycosyltransferase family 2 protein [Cytobacillus gottheilii]